MKGLNGLIWQVAAAMAGRHRKQFRLLLQQNSNWSFSIKPSETVPLNVVSFSGTRDLPEQILSILSFLNSVGQPIRWTLYSDGTIEPDTRRQIENINSALEVRDWNQDTLLDPLLIGYSQKHAMGKRMAAYSQHPMDGPTLFVDSDVIFYARAKHLMDTALKSARSWFLPDIPPGAFDTRYVESAQMCMYHVNGGFLLLQPAFCWTAVLDYLRSLNGHYEYFSDQTALHVALLQQSALPLDPRRFVLSANDQFALRSSFDPHEMAARHYVAIVRHKLWQFGWRWHIRASQTT